MAFTGNFSVTQNADLISVTFVDLSTGSDGGITSRRIYPRNAAGTLVLPSGNTSGYIDWPLPLGTNLTVDLLQKDIAPNVEVVWISSSPLPASDYDVTILSVFTKYTKQFIYERAQDLAAQESLRNDQGWYQYFSRLQSDVDTAELSGTADILDILAAQTALDDAFYIMSNYNKFF